MSDAMKQAWSEVGESFSSLGRTMSEHYRSEGGAGEDLPAAAADEATESTDESQTQPDGRAGLRDAFEHLIEAARQFGARTAEAARDDEVKTHAKQAAKGLSDALSKTAETIGEQVGGLFRRSGNEEPTDEGSGSDPEVVGVPENIRPDVRASTTGLVTSTDVDETEAPPTGDDFQR